ncbi:MAG: DNA repair protein RecO [Bacillota bacterium]|nr:DNA repair protein RecO [Bacillota bacterium]
MYIQTEGIILRQVKTVNARRMISIFSKNYGKISCGTNITEGGKNKTALALRPFTYGRYELFKNKDSYNVQAAETIKSYYGIGEDIDKYMAASFVLELTDLVLLEGEAQPNTFNLLKEFFEVLEKRKTAYQTLVIAYELKLLKLQGLTASDGLKSRTGTDIIESLKFMEVHKLSELEHLALKADTEKVIKDLLKEYFSYHLGIDHLKSEGIII